MKPNESSNEAKNKLICSNLQGRIEKQTPKFILGQLVRTADIKRNFSKGDSTNYSFNFTKQLKSHMTLFLHIESNIYPRDIIKFHYYQPNYLLNKIIK